MQTTVATAVKFSGKGLHSGAPCEVVISPAPANTGIVFIRDAVEIPALYFNVEHEPLCTNLNGRDGARVSTIEHLMAAISALKIDNLYIHASGEEIPIMDGSALPFLRGLMDVGRVKLEAERSVAVVVQPVSIKVGASSASLLPASSFSASIEIDFANPAIGRQCMNYDGSLRSFIEDIAECRTFCMEKDIKAMHLAGKALGGTMDNAVVFGEGSALNPEGLRKRDEPVRHKMLDAIGDLALLGMAIEGNFLSSRPGHKVTNLLLRRAVEAGALLEKRSGKIITMGRQIEVQAA